MEIPNKDITRPKTENSIHKISIPQDAVELLVTEHQKHPGSPWMFPSPKTGEMYHPDSVVNIHKKILKDAGLEHLRFHDLRHPYVKHTTKNKSLQKQKSQTINADSLGFLFFEDVAFVLVRFNFPLLEKEAKRASAHLFESF